MNSPNYHVAIDSRFQVLCKKTSQIVNNSIVLVNDNTLNAVINGEVFEFEMLLLINSPAAADFDYQLAGNVGWSVYPLEYAPGAPMEIYMRAYNTEYTKTTTGGAAVDYVIFRGYIVTNGVNGSLTLQWAQHAAVVDDTILLPGSYLRTFRIR